MRLRYNISEDNLTILSDRKISKTSLIFWKKKIQFSADFLPDDHNKELQSRLHGNEIAILHFYSSIKRLFLPFTTTTYEINSRFAFSLESRQKQKKLLSSCCIFAESLPSEVNSSTFQVSSHWVDQFEDFRHIILKVPNVKFNLGVWFSTLMHWYVKT